MAGDKLIVSRDIGKNKELDALGKAAERREAAANQPPKAPPIASGGKPAINPLFISNKTIGRIKSMQCSRDDIDPADPKAAAKNRLQEQQQRYTDHATGKDPLPPQESHVSGPTVPVMVAPMMRHGSSSSRPVSFLIIRLTLIPAISSALRPI